jgi:hypothetical protein
MESPDFLNATAEFRCAVFPFGTLGTRPQTLAVALSPVDADVMGTLGTVERLSAADNNVLAKLAA